MKHIKIFLILLISTYLFVVPTITYAMANPNATPTTEESKQLDDVNIIADFSNSMIEVSNTIVILKDIDPAVASSLASNFANVMKYAGYAGTVLGIVNGSVAFMKMIGVMKDPTEQKLINISDQLDNINDRMTEMDNKLNNITSEMAKMEASIEFHARDQKADYLMGRWKDFNYQYMETGLDKSLVDYQAMIINGVKNWVKNNSVEERSKGEVDNSRIIMLYKKNSSGEYQLQFTSDNEIPKNFSKDDRYIILNKDVLTDNINWNVETYTQDIKSAISGGIYRNLLQKNFSAFETQNYPFLTPGGAPAYIDQGPQLEINKIAEDATQALLYRITSAEVNKDAKFTKNLIQQYTNYTNHLMSSEEGIDAMLKTIFLTHAFEVQTKEDINDFLNRMIVKSGAYGLFVINVLGMSNAATEQEKTNAVEQVNKQIKYLKDAKKNSITGMDSYSYITNTRLALVDAHFNGDARLDVRIGPGNRRAFKGFSASGLSGLEHGFDFNNDYSVIGDSNFMLVQKTMQSNGLGSDFNTLHNYMPGRSDNHDAIITSYSSPQDMPLDGTITVNFKNISGDYFSNSQGKNKLPSDASNEYVKFKQKITGTTFVPSTGQLQSGRNLLALGAYAEAHDRWFVDETAFFGGPSDYSNYYERLDQTATLTETVPPEEAVEGDANTTVYAFNYHIDATYNVIFSIQMPEEEKPANNLLGASNDTEESYNPLISYKNMDMNLISNKTDNKKCDSNLAMIIGLGISSILVGLFTFIFVRKNRKTKKTN